MRARQLGQKVTRRCLCSVVLSVVFSAHAQGPTVSVSPQDWELVRSVPNPYGGSQELVLIPALKQRDRDYYTQIGKVICAARERCTVQFWTDRSRIPTSASMRVDDLREMTADYSVNPNQAASVRLACRFYPTREAGELMGCFSFPGGG
jgi:hypothetical protein